MHWVHNFYPTKGGGPSHVLDIIKNGSNFKSSVVTDSLKNHANKLILDDLEIYRFPSNKYLKETGNHSFLITYLKNLLYEYQRLRQKFDFLKIG